MAHNINVTRHMEPYAGWNEIVTTNDVGLLPSYSETITPLRSLIRPDNETSQTALHRVGYPGIEYNRPIPINGGSFPFHSARVISGPSGFTVNTSCTVDQNGVILLDENYGRMIWPNAVAGTYNISIGIRDQNYQRGAANSAELVINFELRVDASLFVTLGSGQDETSISGIYGLDANDTTYQNKVVLARAGTYSMPTVGVGADQLLQWNSNKPLQFLAYPNEQVNFDYSNAVMTIDDPAANDIAFSGINFIGSSNQTIDNKHNILVRANIDRFLLDRYETANNGSNPASNENPAVITATDDGSSTPRIDWALIDGVHKSTNNSPLFVLYNTTFTVDNLVIEDGADGNQGIFYAKAGNPNSTLTRVQYVGSQLSTNTDWLTSLGGQSSGSGSVNTNNIEMRYSYLRFADADLSNFILRMINSANANGNYYVRRSTIGGRISIPNWSAYTSTVEDCVLLANTGEHIESAGGSNTFNDNNNLKVTLSDNRLSVSGLLDSTDEFFGQRGHGITNTINSSSNALTAESRRFDIGMNFNGTQGQVVNAPNAFNLIQSDTTYETSEVTPYEGSSCAKMLLDVSDQSSQSYGRWGGGVEFFGGTWNSQPVTALYEGDEIFLRFYYYIPSGYELGVDAWIKWFRISCYNTSDGNGGRQDFQFGTNNSMRWIYEQQTDGSVDDQFSFTLPRDRWFEVKVYVKLHSTSGQAVNKWWIDGTKVLDHTRPNLAQSDYKVAQFLMHTTWNGSYPSQSQSTYLDNLMFTTDRATALALGSASYWEIN